ncbi:MAG TPA: EF-hand domain-containing protein [Sphingomicrobium sp.]|nr:EF-hand domain-containing protein [Sphingomicrobium sp.]
MNRILLSAVALVIAVPAMAQVQAPLAPVAPIAPRMDVTHTRDQAVAKVREHFAKMDTNRDGFVAADEMQSMRGQHKMGERRGRGGRDRMAMADPSKAFDRLDANRDGSISRDEFGKAREMRIERRAMRNAAPGAPGAAMHGEHHGMRKMHRMGGGMMKMADLDRDGRVSLQEATNHALQRFDRIDANRDGRITPDERRQNRELRKAMRAPKAG